MDTFASRARQTWRAIEARIERTPVSEVVPEDALATIENVIMKHHDDAYDLWPTNRPEDRAARIQFWKERVLAAVPARMAGLFAVYFHEYTAATLRGAAAPPVPTVFTADDESWPEYGGEVRASIDAYLACTAGD